MQLPPRDRTLDDLGPRSRPANLRDPDAIDRFLASAEAIDPVDRQRLEERRDALRRERDADRRLSERWDEMTDAERAAALPKRGF